MFRPYALLFVAVFACSVSILFIKASQTHPITLAAARLLISAVLLTPLFCLEIKRHRATWSRRHLWRTLFPGLLLAAHFISWAYGARMTLAAPASLIVNLVPIAVPFFIYALTGEGVTRAEITGTLLALSGVFVLTARDVFRGGGDLWGNVTCFGSMLLFAWYLALGRQNRDFPSVWLYVLPVYAFAGMFCAIAALPWLSSFAFSSPREWSLLLGLAVVPTIIGHSLLNSAMRQLSGQIVSLCNVAQFLFAAPLAFLLFRETPTLLFYPASVLVVAGIALVIFAPRVPAK